MRSDCAIGWNVIELMSLSSVGTQIHSGEKPIDCIRVMLKIQNSHWVSCSMEYFFCEYLATGAF